MSGKIISCTNLDSVRIEVLGEGRAITIPAKLLLAADRVLRNLGMDTSADLIIAVQQSENDGPRRLAIFACGVCGGN